MTDRAITWTRVMILVFYALIGGYVAGGGISAAELVLMAVMGIVCFVAIALADWINNAPRDGE